MYLFMKWSVRYGQMTKTKSKTPKFITLQVLGAVSTACHVGPDGKSHQVVRKQKTGARGKFRLQPRLGFPRKRQVKAGKQFRTG